jgi:regulator of cell morphogenesis and NO signaling
MQDYSQQTLAGIVTGNHRAAAVFEKYQLDFCCRGKRSLLQACSEKQLSANRVIAELQALEVTPAQQSFPFEALQASRLAEYIVDNYHSYVKKELPQLAAYAEKVAAKHGERHPELLRIFELVTALQEEMEMHMQKEEKILFPRIAEMEKAVSLPESLHQLNPAYLQGPVTVMEHEHDHAGDMMAEINQLTHQYTTPDDACTTYKLLFASLQAFEINLHEHVHLENNILFPKALAFFTSQEAI